MGIISVEQVDHLYWLGRYTEPVYTTLRIFARSFDLLIEEGDAVFQNYCESLDIPLRKIFLGDILLMRVFLIR